MIKYEGPIYGVSNDLNGRKIYFDTGRTSKEWDAMETKIEELKRDNASLRAALIECKDTLVGYIHGDIENPARISSTLSIVHAAIDAARKEQP